MLGFLWKNFTHPMDLKLAEYHALKPQNYSTLESFSFYQTSTSSGVRERAAPFTFSRERDGWMARRSTSGPSLVRIRKT